MPHRVLFVGRYREDHTRIRSWHPCRVVGRAIAVLQQTILPAEAHSKVAQSITSWGISKEHVPHFSAEESQF